MMLSSNRYRIPLATTFALLTLSLLLLFLSARSIYANSNTPFYTGQWSDPATWNGNIPADGTPVTLPADTEVIVDVPVIDVESIMIPEGSQLTITNNPTTIRTRYIAVMGALAAGTEMEPLTANILFTFYGDDSSLDFQHMGTSHGTKGLFVMGNGRLDMHGAMPGPAWTRLSTSADIGTTQITLADDTGWQVGDEIVITSTDFEAHQAETAIITAIDGTSITLDHPLQYAHYGQQQQFGTRIVENRAEVGLLNRNIVIRGEIGSDATFGAHTMFMPGTMVRISGVEFTRVGQEGLPGRYPIHFHLAADMSASFIRDSSIHRSFNRGITIHGTDNLWIDRNVIYDTIGHSIFLEDAVEQGNIIENNLVILTRTPDNPLIPSDANTFGPASYWISNPNNILRNNVAAGSEGTGFWYDLPDAPTGVFAGAPVEPQRLPLSEFSNNIAHSNHMIGMFIEPYFPYDNQTMTGLTAYKNREHGAWVTSNGQLLDGGFVILDDSAFLDNGTGVLVAGGGRVRNSVYVGMSDNAFSTESLWHSTRPLLGHRFYDGPAGVENSTFYNYQPTADYQAGAFGWRVNIAEGRFMGNHVKNVDFVNANEAYFLHSDTRGDSNTDISYESMVFEDHDGSFGGAPYSVISTGFPLAWDADDTFVPEWNGYIVNNTVGLFRIGCNGNTCPTTVIRDDGAWADIGSDGRFNAAMGRYYTVYRNDTSCNWETSLVHEYAGDRAIFAVPYTCTLTGMEDANTPMLAGSSYQDVVDATDGSVYYYDTDNNMLYYSLVQPRDNEFEIELVNRNFDYVRVFGTGTNAIVPPPSDPEPTPSPEGLTLEPIAITTDTDTPVSVNLPERHSSFSLDVSTLVIASQPSWGQTEIADSERGILSYMPDGSFVGTTNFGYTICDTTGSCDTGSITVTVNAPANPPPDDTGNGVVSGELRQWHRVSVTFDGPTGSENTPETFWNYRLWVTFTNGTRSYTVPGFFAADGDAANTGATEGNKWRVHFTPDATGEWTYTASFRTGNRIAISMDANAGTPTGFHGAGGTFMVAASDKPDSDFRYHGRLDYTGQHHFQFAGSGEYYLKAGADSPENFLGYSEFDGTFDTGGIIDNFLHNYEPHIADWQPGDPVWGTDERGKGIIGALNYLASQNVNSLYFITYNIDGGDGADTWPWTDPTTRDTFDISKLDQWEIVFSHMTARGIQLHFLTQETENDDKLGGNGDLNDIRQLYYREMVARFAHHPVLQWNIGEENSNGPQQQKDFAAYIRAQDAYNHPITIHSNYNAAPFLYEGLFGDPNYEATSIQGDAINYNQWAIEFRDESAAAGRPWAIYGDEQGPEVASNMSNVDELRRDALWGNLMGGGAGVEWYFGYQDDFGDVQSEDFRVAEPLWQDSKHAVDFFQTYVPFWQMIPDNSLVDNGYALAQTGNIYVVYLPGGGTASLTLADSNVYDVFWYNPRSGGSLQTGSVMQISGAGTQSLGRPPADPAQDWAVLVRITDNTGGNTAPTINQIADQTLAEGSTRTISVTASDVDGDAIILSLAAPDFVNLQDNNDGTGTLTLAPQQNMSGTYSVTVTATDENGATASTTFTLTVSTDNAAPVTLAVTQFTLVDASNDTEIGLLEDGTILDLNQLPSNTLNIIAQTQPNTVGSVVFALNSNNNYQTENVAPYTLAGDTGGDYNNWTPDPGTYSLTATPYSEADGGGTAGTALSITFEVIEGDSNVNQPPIIAAIPNQTFTLNDAVDISVSADDPDNDDIVLSITGLPDSMNLLTNGNGTGQITGTATPAGSYVVTITASDGVNSSSSDFILNVIESSEDSTILEVTGFSLVDASTGDIIQPLTDGIIVDADTLPTADLAVQAELSSGEVAEVHLDLNGTVTVDTTAPFTVPVTLDTHTLTAIPYQTGSLTAYNPADYGYDASRRSISMPAGAVRLYPGDDIQTIVDSYPLETAFVLSPGIYREQSIIPKHGNQFYGEDGAVLSGARLLTNFQQEGSYWFIDGQTQQGPVRGECRDTAPRCDHPEDLFIDNTPLTHVSSLTQVVPGTWFFDYNADRIYLADNPAGRTVETSVTEFAFGGTADSVVVSNLTIEKYASPAQMAAISAVNTTGWTVQNNIIRLNHAGGIQLGNAMQVINNYVVNNGQIGVSGIGDNILVEWNDIGRNNYAGYNSGWEAGGTKFVLTDNLMVRRNYIYENDGPGLWTDIDNINTTYEANLVMNNAGMGIFHEISYAVSIYDNVAMYNAVNDAPWLYGGQIVISTSSDAQVYNNRVVISDAGGNGITVLQQNRGSGEYGLRRSWNNAVFNNTIVHLGNEGWSGIAADWEETSFIQQGGNSFDRNTYYVNETGINHWIWQDALRWKDFQARGQEANGTVIYDNDNGLVARTPVSIQFTLQESSPEPIVAPDNLTATPVSDNRIDLTWVDNAINETRYEVERNNAIISPVPADSTMFFDNNLTAETEYCYRVRAVNDTQVSAWSEAACATTNSHSTPPNTSPTLESPGDQTNHVGDTVSLQLIFDDAESTVRFAATGLPPGLSAGLADGLISGSPTETGTYQVTVTVRDAGDLTDSVMFNWVINGDDSDLTNAVTDLVLVNADTNQDIMSLSNGLQIDLNALPTRNLNVRAKTTSGVESVQFSLNAHSNYRVENQPPYALEGDTNGNYNAWSPQVATYTLTATPYSQDAMSGSQGTRMSIQFTFFEESSGDEPPVQPTTVPTRVSVQPTAVPTQTPVPQPTAAPTQPADDIAVTGYILVNADTDQDVMALTDRQTLSLSNLPQNLNIRVRTRNNNRIESVQIVFNGNTRVENEAPYAVHLDDGGDYRAWTPTPGTYRITATPYTEDYANGTVGTSLSITVTLTD